MTICSSRRISRKGNGSTLSKQSSYLDRFWGQDTQLANLMLLACVDELHGVTNPHLSINHPEINNDSLQVQAEMSFSTSD